MDQPGAQGHADSLAARINAARARHFVGRTRELQHWHGFTRPDNARPLWFLHGIAGIGKTMLLRLLEADAVANGLPVAYLDAARIAPNPPAAHGALIQALQRATCTADADHSPILLIDSFEYWEGLQHWLRETFLPGQSTALKIVFAGQREPDQEWYTDAGWRSLVTVSTLVELTDEECRTYLWRRQIADRRQQRLIRLSGGHPLTLAIASDAVRAGQPALASLTEADEGLIEPLVQRFTRNAITDDQKQALDAAAIVRQLNAALLARMLELDDASSLFSWLMRQSFMISSDTGIAPHNLVRDSLARSMAERAPGRYERLAANAMIWIVDRLATSRALSWDATAELAADAMYALRLAPMVRHFMTPAQAGSAQRSLYLDHWHSGDDTIIHPMIVRHEGQQSLHWFRFWQRQQPASVTVLRNIEREPVAFFLKLDMEALDPQARDTDPLTRKLWQALQADLRLRPGDHVPFIRHWVTHDYAISDSPEKTHLLMAIHTYNLMAANLRLSAQVFDDDGQWEQPAAALGIFLLPDSDTPIGHKNWRIYYNDWSLEPPLRYYRRLADRLLGYRPGQRDTTAAATLTTGNGVLLDEPAFCAAALVALRHLHNLKRMRRNPLLNCALVAAQVAPGATARVRLDALHEIIETTVTTLATHGDTGARQALLLRTADLDPESNQTLAAATLHMGYSTFRRHLAGARQTLINKLWRRERAHR